MADSDKIVTLPTIRIERHVEDEQADVKSCPFCGKPGLLDAFTGRGFCSDTIKCGAIGPNHLFKRVNKEAWNTRAPTAS